jgi:cellulose synthase/poly-beta-1,6-N-acetylglucosamine synthase-like glycosyltransferase
MKAIRPTVSICISAHNEEKNIVHLLAAILNQHQTNWKLAEILVYCDGCTDHTASLAKSLRSKYIRVIDDGKRTGKVGRVNEFNKTAKGDMLVIFDADLLLAHDTVIRELVTSLYNQDLIALVGGNTQPILPKTFFERAVFSTFLVFEKSRKFLKEGNNIFGCNGGCIAYKKGFAQSITIPNVINEDDYLYFSCLKQGHLFKHSSNAIVYYKLPQTLIDYLSQTYRSNPEAVVLNFTKHFGPIVSQEYHRPFHFLAKSVLQSFFVYPFETLYIVGINLLSKPFFPIISTRYKLEWYNAPSTK